MSKHTSGPWEIYDEEYDDVLGYQEPKIIANGDNRALVHEIATIRIGLAATPANARLIAAAPELLEHLKDMVRRFEGCLITNGTDKEFARGATVHARAAIAKAEG